MANAVAAQAATLVSSWTPTTYSVVALIVFLAGMVVKFWPLLKGKLNEARKIELDADADFRGDLLQRVKELEESQHKDRLDFYTAMGDERKRCDAELDAIRARLTHAENENKGLMSAIRQHSQSAAALLDADGKLGLDPHGKVK